VNNIDRQYLDLLQDILDNGVEKSTRNGKVLSVFGRQIRHKMSEGFPLITTKRMAWQTIKTELQWFLMGSTDIRDLWKYKCYIWDGDWYAKYSTSCSTPYSLEEMKEFALNPEKHPTRSKHFDKSIWNLGPVYGKQWRRWSTMGEFEEMNGLFTVEENEKMNSIDQIQNLINELKTNPDSRRLMVSAWNVADLSHMALPPCHYGFQVYTRELSIAERLELASKKYSTFDIMDFGIPFQCTHEDIDNYYPVPTRAISLMWNQRSVDTPLGLPFNIASYGLLLLMLADEVDMVTDELIGNLGDVHIYENQIDGVKEQLSRDPFPLPTVKVRDGIWSNLSPDSDDVVLENYQSHPTIKMPLSN
jgi:thymidylate synthase